jgi:hypothetical protein
MKNEQIHNSEKETTPSGNVCFKPVLLVSHSQTSNQHGKGHERAENEGLDKYRTRLRSSVTVKDVKTLSNDKENTQIPIDSYAKITI